MVPKLHFPTHFTFYSFLTIIILFFCSININAQCAGDDNVMLTVCDITNPASQVINLYAELGGTPTPGGTWKDDDRSGGLDKTTGVLNAQQIKKSGIYHYIYTVAGVSGCADNTAVVTVTIGGYTGVPGPNSSICNTEIAYNLYQTFNGNFLAPQTGGTWVGNTSSVGLTDNFLNTTTLYNGPPPPTYEYTYSIAAIGTCAAPPDAKVFATVYRSPLPGTPSDLRLCSNELSTYTNLNLNDQLSGEDAGGVWTEISTDEIDNNDDTDSTINIQNIYNTSGPGMYHFIYTVFSDNNVCFDQTSDVFITIEKLLDYTGATIAINPSLPICENEVATTTVSATIQNVTNIPDGSYNVTYTISSNGLSRTTTSSFVNNVLTFSIASNNFTLPRDYTITVTNIVSSTTLNICNNIIPLISGVFKVNPIPRINSATVTIGTVCQTVEDATVTLSGNHNLTDGNYDILYNLSAPNLATGIPAVINVVGGIPSFKIPTSLIPKSGKTTITITNITNTTTGCTNISTANKEFTINPAPDISNLTVAIKDVCQGKPTTVELTGLGALTFIDITYTISGFNTMAAQTIPLAVVAGKVSFPIPVSAIPNVGLTTFTITNITNALNGCPIPTIIPKDFTVNPIPATPIADDVQSFCTSDNATVANLRPQGIQYQWFDSVSTVPLISTKPLVTGNYSVKEVNALTGCESELKAISVVINTIPQIDNAIAVIDPICQGSNVIVNFTAGSTNLTDGNYDILYNLNDSNVATGVSTILNVANGIPSFTINSNLIPNAGNTTIVITNITNVTNTLTHCTNTSTFSEVFVVNATPDVSTMIVTVKDGCLGQDLNVDLTGLVNLTNITVSYAVSGANTIALQTIPLIVNAGKTSFLIPGSSLSATGDNTLVLTNITGNSCSTSINTISEDFAINTIPSSPTAGDQNFCETDLKTVANLVPSGSQYNWYDTATSTTPLALDNLLATGDYFIKEVNGTSSCESVATAINVLINTVASPVLESSGHEFCGVEKPTIQDLSDNVTSNGTLSWYDAAANGTLLTSTDLLTEGTTYYGFYNDTSTGCYSNPLVVTVSLTDCTATADNFFIPDGFSPNGDGVNETFQIIDIEFLFPNYALEIFNRYGNVLFKGDINKPAWDGKNSNSSFINGDAPTGVYFYIIHYNKDNLAPKQGQLYLNR